MLMKKSADIRELFLGLDENVRLRSCKECIGINFDNAATTPPFKCAIEEINKKILTYGSIGRGLGQKAEFTTMEYLNCKKNILNFFGVGQDDRYTVIFTSNTTEGINRLSKVLIQNKNDMIISTRMEHHSNDLPWRRAGTVEYVEVDEKGRLKIEQYEELFTKYCDRIKYITVTGASNVTGYLNDIHKIAKIAHKHGAKIIVDGAQLVPHKKVNLLGNEIGEEIDYIAFSGHKFYAPFGSGAIVGLKEKFNEYLPDYEGGGTVEYVKDWGVKYLESPEKNEPGTPNYLGVVGMSSAFNMLEKIGMDNLENIEIDLFKKLINGVKALNGVITYADTNYISDRLAIGTFNINNKFHQDVAEILAKDYGIAVRQGWFCAHPYCRRLMGLSEVESCKFLSDNNKKMPGMFRVSIGPYNTEQEINYLLEVLEKISK
ncbi:MAG: aminotransferase class V-fold PLP-dependent enzyme [Clostridium sp.]